jgi:hypothetical protein
MEGCNWWLIGIYGPHADDEKLNFLQELHDWRALCNGPVLIAMDFNFIYQTMNKKNANLNRALMGHFGHYLDDVEVKEIPLLGRKYTCFSE